jgi:hypothetical protein
MANVVLSVAIMTHPDRQEQLQNLIDQIGDQTEYTIITDTDGLGIWGNAMRAWRAYTPEATHHMVLQDDVILSRNFFSIAKKLISRVFSGDSVSFCDNLRSEMNLAEKENYHWAVTTKVRHGQCLVQPVGQIEDFIHFCEWFVRPDYDHDDGRLEMFLKKHRRAIWHSVPSLVEHDDRGSVGGEMNNDHEPYLAFKFIGKDNQADEKLWTSMRVGFRPATLRIVDQWAIGDISVINAHEYPGHEMFSKPTATIPYETIIAQARIDRGITTPYVIPLTGRSAALANPCQEGEPCN